MKISPFPGHPLSRPVAAALLVIAIAYSAWAGGFIWKTSVVGIDGNRYFCQFDDEMITMRYAWNLAHGQGLAWNPGERVEGFTDWLNLLVKSLFLLFLGKNAASLAGQVMNLPVMLGAAFFAFRIGRRTFSDGEPWEACWLPVAAFAATLLYFPLSFWALGGMETGLVTLFLLAATDLALAARGETRSNLRYPLLLGLAFLSHPSAGIPAAVLLAYRALGVAGKEGWKRTVATEGALFAAFPLVLEAFRLAYFGEWSPNTYLLKVQGIPLGIRLENGFLFLKPFLVSVVPALALAAAGLVLKASRDKALLGLLFLSGVAYQVWVGGDFLNYWRMICPVMPFLFILVLEGARQGARFLPLSSFLPATPPIRPLLVGLAFAISLLTAGWAFLGEQVMERKTENDRLNKDMVDHSILLLRYCRPTATVAVTRGGAIPFFTGFYAIDLLGKADKHVAASPPQINLNRAPGALYYTPGHNRWDLEYSVTGKKPTYLMQLGVTFGQERTHSVSAETSALYDRVFLHPFAPALYLLRGSPDVDWAKVERTRKMMNTGLTTPLP